MTTELINFQFSQAFKTDRKKFLLFQIVWKRAPLDWEEAGTVDKFNNSVIIDKIAHKLPGTFLRYNVSY